MFFEGTEKKLQLICSSKIPSLRAMGGSFWQKIVTAAGAEILSSIHNDDCDAYLLSESSLFVWDNRFVLITCGATNLVNSALEFIKYHDAQHIEFLSYQRKNEYCSILQPTHFQQDVEVLKKLLDGTALQIGELDGHHHYLFTSNTSFMLDNSKQTYELLMYNISGELVDFLIGSTPSVEKIRELLKVFTFFDGFKFDDYLFEPVGYSINGIKEDKYFTIHITPQGQSSYASFETNLNLAQTSLSFTEILLEIFNPISWDVIVFNKQNHEQAENQKDSWQLAECNFHTNHGVKVCYEHFHKPETQIFIPRILS